MFLHRKQDSYADHGINLLDLAYLANYHKIYDNFLILDFKDMFKKQNNDEKKTDLIRETRINKTEKSKE